MTPSDPLPPLPPSVARAARFRESLHRRAFSHAPQEAPMVARALARASWGEHIGARWEQGSLGRRILARARFAERDRMSFRFALSRPALPTASWLGVSPPVPEPAEPEIVPSRQPFPYPAAFGTVSQKSTPEKSIPVTAARAMRAFKPSAMPPARRLPAAALREPGRIAPPSPDVPSASASDEDWPPAPALADIAPSPSASPRIGGRGASLPASASRPLPMRKAAVAFNQGLQLRRQPVSHAAAPTPPPQSGQVRPLAPDSGGGRRAWARFAAPSDVTAPLPSGSLSYGRSAMRSEVARSSAASVLFRPLSIRPGVIALRQADLPGTIPARSAAAFLPAAARVFGSGGAIFGRAVQRPEPAQSGATASPPVVISAPTGIQTARAFAHPSVLSLASTAPIPRRGPQAADVTRLSRAALAPASAPRPASVSTLFRSAEQPSAGTRTTQALGADFTPPSIPASSVPASENRPGLAAEVAARRSERFVLPLIRLGVPGSVSPRLPARQAEVSVSAARTSALSPNLSSIGQFAVMRPPFVSRSFAPSAVSFGTDQSMPAQADLARPQPVAAAETRTLTHAFSRPEPPISTVPRPLMSRTQSRTSQPSFLAREARPGELPRREAPYEENPPRMPERVSQPAILKGIQPLSLLTSRQSNALPATTAPFSAGMTPVFAFMPETMTPPGWSSSPAVARSWSGIGRPGMTMFSAGMAQPSAGPVPSGAGTFGAGMVPSAGGLLQRAPSMPLPAMMTSRAAVTSEERFVVSRSPSEGGGAGASSGSGETAASHPAAKGAGSEHGAAAGDIHLLATEVWSLLKRRLAVEAERMGRS